MEHIGNILKRQNDHARFRRETATPGQRTTEPELSLEERREELRQSLRVSSLSHTFRNFEPVRGTKKALAAFRELAAGDSSWKMLLCYGGVGNGKTYLCEATAIALCRRGIFCRVLTMARIMTALKQALRPDAMTAYAELLERYCRASHLIVDDVGMGGSGSEWEYGQLEELVVARYRERLFTILTTNRDLSELPERVVSRFQDPDVGRVVLNEGPDYRQMKLKGKPCQ